jgi:hypothetical protein
MMTGFNVLNDRCSRVAKFFAEPILRAPPLLLASRRPRYLFLDFTQASLR